MIMKQLQSSNENIVNALSVVNSVREDLQLKRGDLDGDKCKEMVQDFKQSSSIPEAQTGQRRRTLAPSRLDDYLITERIPSENISRSKLSIFIEALDLLETEFDRRFASENTDLWKAMEALSPSSQNFLQYEVLKPFTTTV